MLNICNSNEVYQVGSMQNMKLMQFSMQLSSWSYPIPHCDLSGSISITIGLGRHQPDAIMSTKIGTGKNHHKYIFKKERVPFPANEWTRATKQTTKLKKS